MLPLASHTAIRVYSLFWWHQFNENADPLKQMEERKSELSKKGRLENSQRSRPGCRARKVEIAAVWRAANLAWGKVTFCKE